MRIHPTPTLTGSLVPASGQLRLASLTTSFAHSSIEYVQEVVVVSPRAWTLVWATVLFLIVSNAVVLAVFAVVYSQGTLVDSLLWFLRNFFVVSETSVFLAQHGTRVAIGYGLLSSIFTCIAVRMVVTAIAQRWRNMRPNRKTATTSLRVRTASAIPRSALYCPQRFQRTVSRWRRSISVHGPYFDIRLLVEEWIELTTQTIAAYSASRSIGNTPLNLTYAILIFANSISTSAMTRAFPKSLVKQRLSCVVTDLVLDFLWGTLLPVWMYVPVVQLYTNRSTILEDLTAYSGFTREVQRILVVSWSSYLLSIIPFLSSLLKLLDLQTILRDLWPKPTVAVQPPPQPKRFHVGFQHHSVPIRLAHALLPVYGLGILLTSLAANEVFTSFSKQVSIPCGFRVHPWFATDEACLRRQLNCSTLGITGDAEAFTPMLTQFDSSTLSELHFLDCPALEMPSAIRNFPNLMSIVILNSTVVAWDSDALLSGTFFHDLRNVQLYKVSFSENDPVGFTGLEDEPLAPTLEWIHLQDLDGTRILPLVRDHWRQLQAFACQNCGLTALPDMAYAFERLEVLSLGLNDVLSLPDDWPNAHDLRLQMLWLDGNVRLTELPDSLWRQAATCGLFSVAYTNLSVIPEWVPDVAFQGFQVAAIGTPLCATDQTTTLSPRTRAITLCGTAL